MKCKLCETDCSETHLSETENCLACQEDIKRIIESSEISQEVKDYITENYSDYIKYLEQENEKPEYAAEYHTFYETCVDYYVLATNQTEPF